MGTFAQVPFTPVASASASASHTGTASPSSGALSTSDKIAVGIGVPVGVATIVGTYITWRLYVRKGHKKGAKKDPTK